MERKSPRLSKAHLFELVAVEHHLGQLHAMKKVTGACRSLYPFRQREVRGNALQNLLRKAEQARTLQYKGVYGQGPAPCSDLASR